jgi:hypothetical protein
MSLPVALAFLAAAAAPAEAAPPAIQGPAAPAAKPKKICRTEHLIGSVTPKRTCRTKAEWDGLPEGEAATADAQQAAPAKKD